MKGLWLYFSKAVSVVLALGLHAYVARQSPDQYGALPLAFQWLAFLTFAADFGTTTVAPREWLMAPNAQEYEKGVNSLRFGMAWILATSVALVGIVLPWPLGLQLAPALILWPFGVDWMLKCRGLFGRLAWRQMLASFLQVLFVWASFSFVGASFGPGWLPLALSLGVGLSFVFIRPQGMTPESSVGWRIPGIASVSARVTKPNALPFFRRQSVPFFAFVLMHASYGLGLFVLGFSSAVHPESIALLSQHGALYTLLASGSALVVIAQEVGLSKAGVQARNPWVFWASLALVGLMGLAPFLLPLWLGADFIVSTSLWWGFVALAVLFGLRHMIIHQGYFDTHYRPVIWANGAGLIVQVSLWIGAFQPSAGPWESHWPVAFLCAGEAVSLGVYLWRK